ncbi:MAG: TolB family protein [Gaiellaceae bacterium]
MSSLDLSPDLAARLDMLVPPELARGDWSDVTNRVRRRRKRATLKIGLALALFVVLAAVATATYLVLRGGRGALKPSPGSLTVMTGGYGPYTPATIDEVRPGGRLIPVWHCPRGETCAELTGLAWAPDGRHLAVTLDSIACACTANGLHILDLKTGRDRHVWLESDGRYGCSPNSVSWSPDSRTLAFACGAGGTRLIRDDGTDLRRLARGSRPSWSPDGEWIAVEVETRTTCCAIDVVRVDGSGRRRIVADGTLPAWSPDGKRIAYRAKDGIRFVTPTGVDITPGGKSLAPRGAPAWSPDGTRLAIGTLRGVFVVRADGSNARKATPAGGSSAGFGLLRPAWYPRPTSANETDTTTCGGCS